MPWEDTLTGSRVLLHDEVEENAKNHSQVYVSRRKQTMPFNLQ